MEILYLWINCSEREVIEKQGFNFSPEFKFEMNYIDRFWKLSQDLCWHGKKSIYKSDEIENVTAIVGKNGVGKTTLLNYLLRLNCSVVAKDSYREGYEELKKEDEKKEQCVIIIRENEKIVIYQNLGNLFGNMTEFRVLDMKEDGLYKDLLLGHKGFKNFSKIYLSNSNYITQDGISTDGRIDEIQLSPVSLSVISGIYYKKLLELENSTYTPNIDWLYRSVIKAQKTVMDFQQICDIVYFHKLKQSGKIGSYFGKVSSLLEISVDFCGSLVEKKYKDFHQPKLSFSENSKLEKGLYDCYWRAKENYKNFLTSEETLVRILCANLTFEICLYTGCDWPDRINDYEELEKWIAANCIDTKRKYFYQAKKEIEDIKRIFIRGERFHNKVPREDWAYRSNILLNYEKNRKIYFEFLDYVKECFEKDNSFMLRYLRIDGLGMSSGERAFQNFFSWINLLPQFHNITANMPHELKDTVLLLIDELDLYLHPEWQVKFLNNLLSELENQFATKKIQIIFTTHSPLCLSDVPNENTIFLSTLNGKVVSQDRAEHIQSFGRDVYTLLNDAFYLENCTMGTYAEAYVNKIMDMLYDRKNKQFKHIHVEEVNSINEQISYIGNDILRKKLKQMLLKCIDDREAKAKYLMEEKRKIEEQLAVLEAEEW